jgi:DNA-binding SARP family transcriptional activator
MPSDTLDDDAQGLRIWLLGGFRVAVGSRIIVEAEWRLRKARSLIKVLALAPSYRLHREQVMELLWPEQAPQAAANSLHQTLYVVRRILAPDPAQRAQYLQLQDERLTLCLVMPLWVDVAAFETAAAQARQHQDLASYQVALNLYTGDLLPDDRYEEWASARREALRLEYLDLLRDLAQLAEAHSDYALSIGSRRAAIQIEDDRIRFW